MAERGNQRTRTAVVLKAPQPYIFIHKGHPKMPSIIEL